MDELTAKGYGASDNNLLIHKEEESPLYAPSAVAAYPQVRHCNLEESTRLDGDQRIKAHPSTRELLLSPPAGWPAVGNLKGAVRWAAVDTETTGLDPAAGCRCIEVAAIIVENGQVTTEWATRINPGPVTTWEEGAIKCNGITANDLVSAPSPAEAWNAFLSLTAGLPLVAHNAPFDRRFIETELAMLGLRSDSYWHCTMGSTRRRLESLYYTYARRRINGAHSALGDARAVAYLAPLVCR